MIPGRDQFVCTKCDLPADEDEEPAYCPHCGWDGFIYATDATDNEEELDECQQ